MNDHLYELAAKARARVGRGYYYVPRRISRRHRSLAEAIKGTSRTPVITEIKYASPSLGKIRTTDSPLAVADAMVAGGACGLSILTDPESFDGSLDYLSTVARSFSTPLLMKDIIISPVQLRAGADAGADAVVLISELFSRGLGDMSLRETVEESNKMGLEVLVEANSLGEFEKLCHCKAQLYGINNRDLATFTVDLSRTEDILSKTTKPHGPVVAESGIQSCEDIKRLKQAGADAFLVGTSVMKSQNVEEKVRELVSA